jgi:nicotinamidase-related amidase
MPLPRHPLPLLTREVAPVVLDVSSTVLLLHDLHAPFADPEQGWLARRARDKVLTREFEDYFEMLRLITPNIATIADAFRARGFPLIYSCLGHRRCEPPSRFQDAAGWRWDLDGPDGEFPDCWRPRDGEPVVSKPGWGALANPAFGAWLRERDIRSVVVTGTLLDFGIRQTCVELSDRGIGSLIVSDAVCSLTPDGHSHTSGSIAHGLTKLRSTAELLDLLAGLDERASVLV